MMASATGLSNFIRILAGSFGTSLSITLWDRRAAFHHSILAAHVSAFDPTVADALRHRWPTRRRIRPCWTGCISQQAVILATNEMFWLSGCFFVALMLLVWLARPPRQGAAPVASGAH